MAAFGMAAACLVHPQVMTVGARAAPVCKTAWGVSVPPLPSGEMLQIIEVPDLDDESAYDLADAISVGSTIWPSSAALCRYLKDNPSLTRSSNVLELGAGVGVCGLFAAALGATRVLLTDGSHALQQIQAENAKANAQNIPATTQVEYQQYLWGEPTPSGGPWDLVIGSDLSKRGPAKRCAPMCRRAREPVCPCSFNA